jgi:hypothetical protein
MKAKTKQNYNELSQKLIEENKLLKSIIRKVKRDYYHAEFSKHKNNIKKIWGTNFRCP